MGMDNASVNTKLINYLEKHNAGADYLFATTDSNTAAPYIIKTKKRSWRSADTAGLTHYATNLKARKRRESKILLSIRNGQRRK